MLRYPSQLNCPVNCPKDCNECKKPKISQKYFNIIKLFNRCEQLKCLPEVGGVNDQNEKVMQYFDIIRQEYGEFEKEKMDDIKRKAKRR